MPQKKRYNKKIKNTKASPAVRYLFYFLFVFLIVISGFLVYLQSKGIISATQLLVWASIAQSMLFSVIAIAYMLLRGKNLRQIVDELGLSKKSMGSRMVVIGIILFLAILALEIALGLFSAATGIPLPTNVQQIFTGLPIFFLVFSVFIAPINEEILFRGFLVPRWGIVISALIFGALHYLSYASIAEFVAALIFGLLSGYVRKRTKSLYPSIIGHIMVNTLAILSLMLLF